MNFVVAVKKTRKGKRANSVAKEDYVCFITVHNNSLAHFLAQVFLVTMTYVNQVLTVLSPTASKDFVVNTVTAICFVLIDCVSIGDVKLSERPLIVINKKSFLLARLDNVVL